MSKINSQFSILLVLTKLCWTQPGATTTPDLTYLIPLPRQVESQNESLSECRPTPTNSSDSDLFKVLPPPPTFILPPPPAFMNNDCSATYTWKLVKAPFPEIENITEKSSGNKTALDATTERPDRQETPATGESTIDGKHGDADKPIDKDKNKTKDKTKDDEDKDKNKTKRKKNKNKRNKEIETFCQQSSAMECRILKRIKRGRKGPKGPKGPAGRPGPPGPPGTDGIPGLVMFPNVHAMFGVSLEGLIAYRTDVKQLYIRDHVTWRPIRITRCGDGIVDGSEGEQCDDGNENVHDNCIGCRLSYCGDGHLNPTSEQCDGRDFGRESCASLRPGMTGYLTCTPQCRISFERCRYYYRPHSLT